MKIADSSVAFAAQHQLVRQHTRQSAVSMWLGDRPTAARTPQAERVSLSAPASSKPAEPANTRAVHGDELSDDELRTTDPRLLLLKLAVESLTGIHIKLIRLPDASGSAAASTPTPNAAPAAPAQPQPNWGAEVSYQETFHESETMSLSSSGVVHTSDGQQIEFQLSLDVAREFSRTSGATLQLGNAAVRKDPLVINLDVPAASLLDQKQQFDIDGDGKQDSIAMLAPGSAYLALDRNHDGKINNGFELFGAQSGNGFADLAAHDQDGNHWIDSNDAIFQQLKLWLHAADGTDQLLDLKTAGIGAIFLGQVQSPFTLTDQNNQAKGDIRASGIYLTEQGKAGTVQQIDLAV